MTEEIMENEKQAFARRLNEVLDELGAPVDRGRAQFLIKLLPLDISVNGIKKWLKGEAMPETHKFSSIGRALNVRPNWLFFGEGKKEIPQGSMLTPMALTEHLHRIAEPEQEYQYDEDDIAMFRFGSSKGENKESTNIQSKPTNIEFKTFPATVTHGVNDDSAKILGGLEQWDDETPLNDDEVALRFLKSVEGSAGIGNQAQELDNGYKLRFSKRTLARLNIVPENAICIVVSGNSMEPQLPNGSTVAVDTGNKRIIDGKIYAIRHGDMVRIKVLYSLPGNGVRLKSYNENEYEDERYSAQEVAEQHIEVIGRVFWSSVLY